MKIGWTHPIVALVMLLDAAGAFCAEDRERGERRGGGRSQ